MALIGRRAEQRVLREIYNSNRSAFVALYGRRRVGKTHLVREVFQQETVFQCTGLATGNIRVQLANFHEALQAHGDISTEVPTDWVAAFGRLRKLLSVKGGKRKVVFLDELPWMDTAQSRFISALEHFWNSWASARTDIVLIVCGSAAGWMITNLINNRGGLHNRITHRIRLQPFNLHECEQFMQSKGGVYERYQLLLLYMSLGGVPFYLEQVRVTDSAAQNINRLCFERDGMLRTEFDNLYRSLFDKAEKHIAVVELLSKKTRGLTREEIIDGTDFSKGGSVTRVLDELEESSFIRRYAPYGKKVQNGLYQLTDNYSLFYLKWDPQQQCARR